MREPIIVAVLVLLLIAVSPNALFTAQTDDAVPSKKRGTFWVQFLVHGKGDDFLFVLEHPARVPMPRRFRCRTSLPTFVEKIAAVTDTTNGMLIAKVAGTIYFDTKEESIDDLEVLSLCVLESEAVTDFIKAQRDVNIQQADQAKIIEKGPKPPPVPNRPPAPKRPAGPVEPIQGGHLPRGPSS